MNHTQENIQFSDKEIITKIWVYPRQIFKFINEKQHNKFKLLLLILVSISSAFDSASNSHYGDKFSLWAVIGICITGGAFLGLFFQYFYSALVYWTGKLLNGKATIDSILRVFAFAGLPKIVSLLFFIPQIAIYGNEMFKENGITENENIIFNIIFYTLVFIKNILSVWTLVLYIIAISEVQKISIVKSIFIFLLPVIVICLIVIIYVTL